MEDKNCEFLFEYLRSILYDKEIQTLLLQVVGRIGDDDCRICLLPSMQFALDPDEFQNFVNTAEKRMQERWNETDSEMDEEEQDADTDE